MNRLIAALWLAASLCESLAYGQTPPYTLTGRIVSVTDGDTVVMQTGRVVTQNRTQNRTRIRLASIDAPERGGNDRPGQPYGDAAQQFLADLVRGRVITARCFEQDHYRRHICDLLLDGKTGTQTANRRLVAAGLAWANQEAGGKFLRDAAMPELERQARRARRGLWQMNHPRPIAPWQWRARCWRNGRCG